MKKTLFLSHLLLALALISSYASYAIAGSYLEKGVISSVSIKDGKCHGLLTLDHSKSTRGFKYDCLSWKGLKLSKLLITACLHGNPVILKLDRTKERYTPLLGVNVNSDKTPVR